jgi:hypothetical protein
VAVGCVPFGGGVGTRAAAVGAAVGGGGAGVGIKATSVGTTVGTTATNVGSSTGVGALASGAKPTWQADTARTSSGVPTQLARRILAIVPHPSGAPARNAELQARPTDTL